MEEAISEKSIQQQAEETRYTLRASFSYRLHTLWTDLVALVEDSRRLSLDWSDLSSLGIDPTVWERVEGLDIEPSLIFCHPTAIQAEPRLIAYYRCMALLPQKGLHRLAVDTKGFEEGRRPVVDSAPALRISKVLNGLVGLLIESDPNWSLEDSRIAALLNLGTQINGSWRNDIGAEGGRRVKELLAGSFFEDKFIREVLLAGGSRQVATQRDLPPLQTIRGFITYNDCSVVFGSEPDVSIRDTSGDLIGTIEVKYGLDPAGALERYGAAKKSFEQAVRENTRVFNIYLASCFTTELQRRIRDDRLVNQDFNLTEVLSSTEKRTEFLTTVRHLLNL